MLMEGSTIGRTGKDKGYPVKLNWETRFIDIFNRVNGLSLVWASGQNIDRLSRCIRLVENPGKKLVIDMYTANILRSLGNLRLPQPGVEGFVRLPSPISTQNH